MLIFVIICNLLLTLLNLYLVVCLWRWQQRFRQITLTLDQVECQIQQILSPASEVILEQNQQVLTLKQLYQQWSIYLKRFRQVLFLLSFTLNLWRRPLKRKQ